MKYHHFILYMIILGGFSSCYQNKKIAKGSLIYRVDDHQARRANGLPDSDSATAFYVDEGFKATVKDKIDYQTITPIDTSGFKKKLKKVNAVPITTFKDFRNDIKGKYYYGETLHFDYSRGLRYWDSKFVLQAITIALKVRPELVKDSLPAQADANLNFGLAAGWKFNYNVTKTRKNLFGQTWERLSVTPGILFNIGSTDLKKGVNATGIINDRKEPIFSFGYFLMLGYNSINLGFAIGKDYALADGKTQWRYHKKKWYGFTVAIDIIK